MKGSRRSVFIFLLGASVGLMPFMINRINSSSPKDFSDSYVSIAERRDSIDLEAGKHGTSGINDDIRYIQRHGHIDANDDKPPSMKVTSASATIHDPPTHKKRILNQHETTDDENYDESDMSEEIDKFFGKLRENSTGGQRKILLDCGGNMASTVDLFQETYPGGREFVIHSFEIDSRLAPFFGPYPNHHLHCPVGVAAKNGNMTAFTETAWSPKRGQNNGKDMQWGGGTLFVSEQEAKDTDKGGKRLLNVRPTIPIIDLSSWIQTHTSKDDYVIFKLDVEGAEYEILKKMIQDGTFEWIDKYYGEFHPNQPIKGWTKDEKKALAEEVGRVGPKMIDWVGEKRSYADFDKLHPIQVPQNSPGIPGGFYSNCSDAKSVALALAVGMNAKRAKKVIETISHYHKHIPLTLFLYGDFVELFPNYVQRWRGTFDIGVREDGYFPPGHFGRMNENLIRESLVSAELRLQELDIQPVYYLPLESNHIVVKQAQKRGFRVIDPTVEFPPKKGVTLNVDNYYKYRDVERIPKALRIMHQSLQERNSGFLVLDTDLPDTRMNIVFLLDYLVENSGYKLVSVADCVGANNSNLETQRERRSTEEDGRQHKQDRVIDRHSDNSNNHIKLI